MDGENLYSVKMRSSRDGVHISGAERIVSASMAAEVASCLVRRAMSHPRGAPDFINVKLELQPGPIMRLKALPVTAHEVSDCKEGLSLAAELLKGAGIRRMDEIMELFKETGPMRGAMLLDADSLERLEPDRARGVRATYMDAASLTDKAGEDGKNHFAEALVLSTKVANAPGIVGEICVSDDPGYVTGYVATREIGYHRIMKMKRPGDPFGGRIFLYRGPREAVDETIGYLERRCVVVEGA